MKSVYFFLALSILPSGLALAQTGSANRATSATQPISSTVVSNRQQELYDQYHGITRKPITAVPVATPPTNSAEVQKPATPVATDPKPTGTATISEPQRAPLDGSKSGVRIGIRGGVTYPFYTETPVGIDPVLGFVGGLVLNFGKGKVSFQPEINYTRYSHNETSYGFTDKVAVDAVEVPLFLKISSGTYAGNRFFLNVGPYATYLVSASTDGKKVSLDGTKGRFGFGAAAGIGVALKAGPGHVTIEVRGLYPLGDIDNGFSTDSKTILGQGTLGYIFPLGGR